MSPEKIRVLIADDHTLVRKSICALLESQGDMEVVGTAVDGQEAITLAQTHIPDVIVMDVSMPQVDGIHATEFIRKHELASQVIILSMHVNAVLVKQALNKGAKGYILKQHAFNELPQAIRAIRQGETYLSPAIPAAYLPQA
jgi:DNA-binding NarL/FixJ family response regulator